MLTRSASEVLLGLARLARALDQQRVLTARRTERQLVEGEDLAAGLEDAGACRLREAQRGDLEGKR